MDVSNITENFIEGSIGSVEVLVPRSRIPSQYSYYSGDGEMTFQLEDYSRVVRKEDLLMVRCLESRVEMGKMKLAAVIEEFMLPCIVGQKGLRLDVYR